MNNEQPTITMSAEMFNKQYELIINLSSENSSLRNYINALENEIRMMQQPAVTEQVDESDTTE